MSAPPPGWYPDPSAADKVRWWSGDGWTHATLPPASPTGVAPVVPPHAPTVRRRDMRARQSSTKASTDSAVRHPGTEKVALYEAAPAQASPKVRRVRARWGMGSFVSIILAFAAFVFLAVAVSPWCLLLPVIVFAVMWFAADRSKAVRALQARPADPRRDAVVLDAVTNSAAAMGIRMPEVYISPQPVGNAYAGADRRGGYIFVLQGAIDVLAEDELTAMLAHEVGHLKNRDTLYMVFFDSVKASLTVLMFLFAAVITIVIAFFARDRNGALAATLGAGLFAVGSAAAYLLITAGGRSREYGADRLCAETHSDPLALGRALQRLDRADRWEPGAVPVTVAARSFAPPYASSFLSGLASSHPSHRNRIARIEKVIGPARAAESAQRARIAEWEREGVRKREALEFARSTQPAPIPAGAPFTPLRGEQLWWAVPAMRVAPKTVRGETGFQIGEMGRLFVTTERAVFTGPTGRVEWRWAKTHDTSWMPNVSNGDILLIAVENRQRHAGVWVERKASPQLQSIVELALAEHRGLRRALVSGLEVACGAHERLRPAAIAS